MRFSSPLPRIAAVAAVASFALLSGCTTYVASVSKDPGYNQPLANTFVVWIPGGKLNIKTSRPASRSITPSDLDNSRVAGVQLQSLFAGHAPKTIAKALAESRVVIAESRDAAATELTITPTHMALDCAQVGCQHAIWVQASLRDKALKKEVWSGSFKAGAPYPMPHSDTIITNFTTTLVDQLKKASLL